MDINITFHQMHHSDQLEEYCRKKMAKLEKYYSRIQDVHVVLEVKKLDHIVTVVAHLPQKRTIKADHTTKEMYASIDGVYDKLERQLVDANRTQ